MSTEVVKPDRSDIQLRSKLVEMVVNDLFGPAGGPEEEIAERNVRDRYLVGVLAPRTSAVDTAPEVKSAKATTPNDDDDDDEDTPEIPDELAGRSHDSGDDWITDKDVPIERAYYPRRSA